MEGQCNSPGIVSESVKPIRVIDVATTISSRGGVCFKKPSAAADFHVISHTWSQDVRNFSKEIGRLVRNSSASIPGLARAYNDAFRKANFRKSKCYQHLKCFLKMLNHDGVKYVWFDALCINQKNATEKGKEIARMAVYYSNNKGCYVLNHGIGNGYNFWQGEIWYSLPRWFERAWTLQEFVLPTKLTFLVAFNSEEVKSINILMESNKSVVGFCYCCTKYKRQITDFHLISEREIYREYVLDLTGKRCKEWMDFLLMRERDKECMDEKPIHESNKKCKKCGSFPLVRNTGMKYANEMIYFVDRDAYIALVQLFHRERQSYFCSVELRNIMSSLNSIRESPMLVAQHLAERECSNEEDRILCILGLLGSNRVEALRTGQLLYDQIFSVCEQDHDLLIQLCAMSIKGNCKPGMSWAPWLVPEHDNDCLVRRATDSHKHCLMRTRATRRERIYPGPITKRDVDVVGIYPKGIKLRANITRYLVSGIPRTCTYNALARVRSFSQLSRFDYTLGTIKSDTLSFCEHKCFETRTFYDGFLCMPLNKYRVDEIEFEMWWLLLGDAKYGGTNCKVVMACIGKDEGNLHKIGLFWINLEDASEIFQTPASSKRSCCVGGFGEYLDEHVTPTSGAFGEYLDEHVTSSLDGFGKYLDEHVTPTSGGFRQYFNEQFIGGFWDYPDEHVTLHLGKRAMDFFGSEKKVRYGPMNELLRSKIHFINEFFMNELFRLKEGFIYQFLRFKKGFMKELIGSEKGFMNELSELEIDFINKLFTNKILRLNEDFMMELSRLKMGFMRGLFRSKSGFTNDLLGLEIEFINKLFINKLSRLKEGFMNELLRLRVDFMNELLRLKEGFMNKRLRLAKGIMKELLGSEKGFIKELLGSEKGFINKLLESEGFKNALLGSEIDFINELLMNELLRLNDGFMNELLRSKEGFMNELKGFITAALPKHGENGKRRCNEQPQKLKKGNRLFRLRENGKRRCNEQPQKFLKGCR